MQACRLHRLGRLGPGRHVCCWTARPDMLASEHRRGGTSGTGCGDKHATSIHARARARCCIRGWVLGEPGAVQPVESSAPERTWFTRAPASHLRGCTEDKVMTEMFRGAGGGQPTGGLSVGRGTGWSRPQRVEHPALYMLGLQLQMLMSNPLPRHRPCRSVGSRGRQHVE